MRWIVPSILLACLLIYAGWRMIAENARSLQRREGMYDEVSRSQALWSGRFMIFGGVALLTAGLAIFVLLGVWFSQRY